MKRRTFIASAAAGIAAAPFITPEASASPRSGPALLTVSGAFPGGNRGPAGKLDQLMQKHGVEFERAHAFDFAALSALPTHTIEPVVEYDGQPHRITGPLLTTVLTAAGVRVHDGLLVLRAVDGYGAQLSIEQAREQRFIVATHMDGAALPLGGVGPLWAVYDPARVPGMLDKPLAERFANCPWGLYHIEVMLA
ncbi:MAG: molybdopterin-dependent oxidoreductase [Pseudazoarcus pumilus]|nr:molybdopterin-dependent oxidoreductase [Pseudazoarcus pumilus]